MTAAELADALESEGEFVAAHSMLTVLKLSDLWGETAALAIAEARVREMWAKRGYRVWSHETMDCGAHVLRYHDPLVCDSVEFDCSELPDCLHAALQAALEAPDGE